jgi:hypothetical protein
MRSVPYFSIHKHGAIREIHLEKVVLELAALGNISPYIFFSFGTHSRYCHAGLASIYPVRQNDPSGIPLKQVY